MECDGVKTNIPLEPKSRDAQILAALRNSFPNKTSLGNWTDKNDKAIMLVEDSSIREAFLLIYHQAKSYLNILQLHQMCQGINCK